jgi:hypothetical protein
LAADLLKAVKKEVGCDWVEICDGESGIDVEVITNELVMLELIDEAEGCGKLILGRDFLG